MNALPALPRLVMTDIDGVWTDGGMYYDQTGNEWKKFNTSDSAGVVFLRLSGIPVAILTGEDTRIVASRAAKLRIEHVYQGVHNKLHVAQQLCASLGIGLDETAYIGDDVNDIPLLRAAGVSCSPANAPDYVAMHAHFTTHLRGGEGAFREFVETLLKRSGKFDEALRLYAEHLESQNH